MPRPTRRKITPPMAEPQPELIRENDMRKLLTE
jgi:hypothetical protein